jgi:hypothetical protein
MDFRVGFWHPFGPHGREDAEDILARKRREIDENGWTLWSFQKRDLDAWWREILAASPGPVYVFCSEGAGAVDPANEPTACTRYRLIGDSAWQPLPTAIRVPHPFRRGATEASAFVVQQVIYPVGSLELPMVEWWSKGLWRRDRTPTRGEYLIRRGEGEAMRRVRAILLLKDPYLAEVSL